MSQWSFVLNNFISCHAGHTHGPDTILVTHKRIHINTRLHVHGKRMSYRHLKTGNKSRASFPDTIKLVELQKT